MKNEQTVRVRFRINEESWQLSERLLREDVAVEYPSSGKLKRRTQQFLLDFLR